MLLDLKHGALATSGDSRRYLRRWLCCTELGHKRTWKNKVCVTGSWSDRATARLVVPMADTA
jgi:hypothetical protein